MNDHKTILNDEGFSVYNFLRHDSSCVSMAPPLKSEVKSVYVFTDTIHYGNTMADFLFYCKEYDIHVEKIFCVLGNNEGIDNLLSAGLIQDVGIFYSLYNSYNKEEYQNISRDLTVVYASSIGSLNPFSSYDAYSVNAILSSTDLIPIMNEILYKILRRKTNIEEIRDEVFPPNIKQINYELIEYNEIKEYFSDVFYKYDDVYFEGFTITCKIEQMSMDSLFTIQIKSMLNCNDVKYCEIKDRLKDQDMCFKKYWNTETLTRTDPSDIICLPCLDHVFSDFILKKIEEIIIEEFLTFGYDCRQEFKYRPIKR